MGTSPIAEQLHNMTDDELEEIWFSNDTKYHGVPWHTPLVTEVLSRSVMKKRLMAKGATENEFNV